MCQCRNVHYEFRYSLPKIQKKDEVFCMKKIVRLAALITTIALTLVLFTTTTFALYHPDSWYNARCWTWVYSAPYTNSYNCLGYATGSMVWEWPWTGYNPTKSQVTTYLAGKGYSATGSSIRAEIIAYGTTSAITHFSKVTGTAWCRAKWGGLERFNHNSWDPYTALLYGPQVQIYYM